MDMTTKEVGHIFREAGDCIHKVGDWIVKMHTEEATNSAQAQGGSEWIPAELEMFETLKDFVRRFTMDFKDLSEVMKNCRSAKLSADIKVEAYKETGILSSAISVKLPFPDESSGLLKPKKKTSRPSTVRSMNKSRRYESASLPKPKGKKNTPSIERTNSPRLNESAGLRKLEKKTNKPNTDRKRKLPSPDKNVDSPKPKRKTYTAGMYSWSSDESEDSLPLSLWSKKSVESHTSSIERKINLSSSDKAGYCLRPRTKMPDYKQTVVLLKKRAKVPRNKQKISLQKPVRSTGALSTEKSASSPIPNNEILGSLNSQKKIKELQSVENMISLNTEGCAGSSNPEEKTKLPDPKENADLENSERKMNVPNHNESAGSANCMKSSNSPIPLPLCLPNPEKLMNWANVKKEESSEDLVNVSESGDLNLHEQSTNDTNFLPNFSTSLVPQRQQYLHPEVIPNIIYPEEEYVGSEMEAVWEIPIASVVIVTEQQLSEQFFF